MSSCRNSLFVDRKDIDDDTLIGENCHIVAEKLSGPRGQSSLNREQRDAYKNLILLCRNHHKEIDAQPIYYSIEKLSNIKNMHEQWVGESLPGFDHLRQRDDEIYAGFLDQWIEFCNLVQWTQWSSGVLSGSGPQMSVQLDGNLEKLQRWLLVRIWPKRYERLVASFCNFRLVLNDFRRSFHEHSTVSRSNDKVLVTERFYKIKEWNPELYSSLLAQYKFHVDLISDLMAELTRAANLICDEVRDSVAPNFRIIEGRLSMLYGPHFDLSWRESVVQYKADELKNAMPYPGLQMFLKLRTDRDFHFGSGSAP